MENGTVKVLRPGDDNGNGMVLKYRLPSGLEVLGLPTRNFYGGEWDLGPTWNWLVLADRPFLVDTGRYGQGPALLEMLGEYGPAFPDIDFVLLSHGHEDHDGGLAELVRRINLPVKAHQVYGRLIRKYPSLAPPDHKRDFPAKCWHCVMPESFWGRQCRGYHQELQEIEVEGLPDGRTVLAPGVLALHLPGHSPDCLAVRLGDEVLLAGDILLPDITPWPTRESLFDEVAAVLPPGRYRAGDLFGLRRYIRSLKELAALAREVPDILVLPAHRLYYHGRWQPLDLGGRVTELLEHHRNRCRTILAILEGGPRTAEEIARAHFTEKQMEGFSGLLAVNEVVSHCELLMAAGDAREVGPQKYELSGRSGFEGLI
ncbi:MAG: MBL fold metallo-hydrolase [Thermodesulfobacteriota bacterium]